VNCCVCPGWTVAVAGVIAREDKVFVPPEPLLEPPIPWHAVHAIVKAMVDEVKTEKNRKRRVDFIVFLLLYGRTASAKRIFSGQ
jgi:hypothetical protein